MPPTPVMNIDFLIPCFRPGTPALYHRSFSDGNESFKDPGRRGRRRPEEP